MGTEKQQFSVRLPPDAAEEVEEYAEKHGISKADALRRAVDDYFVRAAPDGGEVMDRMNDFEKAQARQNWGDTLQNIVNLAGIAFIVSYFTSGVGGPLGLLAAAVIILAEVGVLAYNYGVFSDE